MAAAAAGAARWAADIRRFTKAVAIPELAGVRLHLVTPESPAYLMHPRDLPFEGDPFWAFCWAGSWGIAKFLHTAAPALLAGKRVLDVGSGSGISAIVAAKLGAQRVVANDIDPVACAAAAMNAELNGVTLELDESNRIFTDISQEFDVVLAGDVAYDAQLARDMVAWLSGQPDSVTVLFGHPKRGFLMPTALHHCATYKLPQLLCEDGGLTSTSVCAPLNQASKWAHV